MSVDIHLGGIPLGRAAAVLEAYILRKGRTTSPRSGTVIRLVSTTHRDGPEAGELFAVRDWTKRQLVHLRTGKAGDAPKKGCSWMVLAAEHAIDALLELDELPAPSISALETFIRTACAVEHAVMHERIAKLAQRWPGFEPTFDVYVPWWRKALA